MATGNLLLGQASGAVGSLVFARANGKQVTKARQEGVRYSNTLAQAIQRICISTAGQAYRHILEVCSRSFQGIQAGKATHDEFMKRNVRLLRQNIRQADTQGLTYSDLRYFTPVGNDTLLPNAYIIAAGSLPSMIVGISPNDPTHARMAGGGFSYRQVIAFYGLKRGDILTFVFMQPDSSGIVHARSARVVLDPWSPISGKASLDVPFIADNNSINCPNPNNSGEFTYLVNDSGDIVYSLVSSDVRLIAAGVFASRRTAAGSWLHSDCQLSLYNDSDILDKFTLQQAIDVANGAPIAAISPDYLNNAGSTPLPFSKSHLLPDGYTQFKALRSINGAYIDLECTLNQDSNVLIDFTCVENTSGQIFGYRYNANDSNITLFCLTSASGVGMDFSRYDYTFGRIIYPFSQSETLRAIINKDRRALIRIQDMNVLAENNVHINGRFHTGSAYVFMVNGNPSNGIKFNGLIHRITIENVCDCFPCMHRGIAGLYDIIRGRFLTNVASTGYFEVIDIV